MSFPTYLQIDDLVLISLVCIWINIQFRQNQFKNHMDFGRIGLRAGRWDRTFLFNYVWINRMFVRKVFDFQQIIGWEIYACILKITFLKNDVFWKYFLINFSIKFCYEGENFTFPTNFSFTVIKISSYSLLNYLIW